MQADSPAALGQGGLTVNGTLDLNGQNVTVASLGSTFDDSNGLITNNSTIACSSPSTRTPPTPILAASRTAQVRSAWFMQGRPAACYWPRVLTAIRAPPRSGRPVRSPKTPIPPLWNGAGTRLSGATVILDTGQPGDSSYTMVTPAPSRLGQVGTFRNAGGMPAPEGNALGPTAPQGDTGPAISAIECAGQSLIDPSGTVVFDVTFSEPVVGVTVDDFTAVGPGTVASVSGSLSQYMVTVNVVPGASGGLGLDLAGATKILDWYGTPLDTTAAIPIDQQFTFSSQLYWDGSHGTGAAGGSGTWGPGYDCWRVGSETGPLQDWVDGSNAYFAGEPGSIDVTNPVQVASMTFLSDGYKLQGATIALATASPAPLASTGEGSVVDVETGSAAIDCQLLADTFQKTGAGTLVLAGGTPGALGFSSIVVTAGALDLAAPRPAPAA